MKETTYYVKLTGTSPILLHRNDSLAVIGYSDKSVYNANKRHGNFNTADNRGIPWLFLTCFYFNKETKLLQIPKEALISSTRSVFPILSPYFIVLDDLKLLIKKDDKYYHLGYNLLSCIAGYQGKNMVTQEELDVQSEWEGLYPYSEVEKKVNYINMFKLDVRPVKIQGMCHMRVRPRLDSWVALTRIKVISNKSETIGTNNLTSILDQVGINGGLGDWRPNKKGQFGRFESYLSSDEIDLNITTINDVKDYKSLFLKPKTD